MTCFVLGGAQSDFAQHLAREGRELSDLTGELVDAVLADAAIEAGAIETIHVGNAFGQLFTGQGHLGAMPATVRPALWGVPAARHEAACASGSIAVLAAAAEIDAGRYDCALVLGVEQERNVPGPVAAQHLAAAAWVGHEGDAAAAARYLWPHTFARVGDLYAERWGLDRAHLGALSQQAFANAKKHPHAQTRSWGPSSDDPIVERGGPERGKFDGCIRRSDCAQVTDGGAAVVLASARFAEAWAARRGVALADVPRLLGWGHRTVGLSFDSKVLRAQPGELLFPHVAAAMTDARRRADAQGPASLDGYEVHDCFTTTMYMAIDHLGLTAPGRSFEAIEDGRAAKLNPGGGLIGIGHPVGATGVRMVVDAARQVSGRAGECQLPGARRIGTLNLGGSASTVVAFVVGV